MEFNWYFIFIYILLKVRKLYFINGPQGSGSPPAVAGPSDQELRHCVMEMIRLCCRGIKCWRAILNVGMVTYNSRISLITNLTWITRKSRDGHRWLGVDAGKRSIIEQQASMNLAPDVRVKACSTTEQRIGRNHALPSNCDTLPVIHSYGSWDKILYFRSEHVSLWG